MDMVCVKAPDSDRDMTAEGPALCTDGEWIWADGTSLGGDDGVALAIAFAVLADDALAHPPLEVVFTVDEEVGMGGVKQLDCSDLKSRLLLNLDCEEFGTFVVSCTGAARLSCSLPGTFLPAEGMAGYAVTVHGLKGGHAGTEIHKGRGNANLLMGRLLYTALERVGAIRLSDLSGGIYNNIIPPECRALVAVPAEKTCEFEQLLSEMDRVYRQEYLYCDGEVTVSWERTETADALSAEDTRRILGTLLILPQGVQAMSSVFPGTVQTSLNTGVMRMEGDGLHFVVTVRSCLDTHKNYIVQQLRRIMELGGGTLDLISDYGSWQYASVSPLRERAAEAYRSMTGREPVITALHGGVECGILQQKLPGLDAVSIGPDMLDIHSEKEKLHVATTAQTYELVCRVLALCR